MQGAYYNENDPFAAAWLRALINKGMIADGEVDERSIVDVQPEDLRGFAQHHFFVGIGGWSCALRMAGWPDDHPVWTGSCPCQPFRAAGQRKGFSDARHLWPHWFRLIRECRPERIFGEQVASAMQWLDLVSGDLEGEGYAVGAAIVGAHSVGAPHIRQRIWFVAESSGAGGQQVRRGTLGDEATDGREGWHRREPDGDYVVAGDGEGDVAESVQSGWAERRTVAGDGSVAGSSSDVALAESQHNGSGHTGEAGAAQSVEHAAIEQAGLPRRARLAGESFWNECDWLPCIDGKSRPVEPGTFPLAHGIPARVGRLRGYGNAIVPQAAAEFIQAYLSLPRSN